MSERLTFEQREGMAELPTQLQPRQISQQLRALLWQLVYDSIPTYMGEIGDPWRTILRDSHVQRDHEMIDGFSISWQRYAQPKLHNLFSTGRYEKVLGFVEFVLQHPKCPQNFGVQVERILRQCKSAYQVVDGDTIGQLGSEQEASTITAAIAATGDGPFEGARTHLKAAASLITAGGWADAVRESIHAVESVAVILSPGSNTLAPALKALSTKAGIHEALKGGFGQIYGFTNDESGIRHALLDKGDANVDEADALFMLGACASFVTYLIAKAQAAGLAPDLVAG